MKAIEKASRLQQASLAFLRGFRQPGTRLWPFSAFNRSRSNLGGHDGTTTTPLDAGNLPERLQEEKDFLLALIRGMETEFLSTGKGLGRLAGQLREIQGECQMLTDLTMGRGQDAAVQFAFQLLKKAEDLVLASYEQYDHVFATFRELQCRLTLLSKEHHALMRLLLPLNFITISVRIEASRHPLEVQQAFSGLAEHVNGTVNEVRGTLERQFEDLATSEGMARRLMEQISASVQQHRKEVTTTLETSRNQLKAFSETLISSGDGATDLSKLNKSVTRHIGTIVMAQQCQDITRQRIEHVGEAMDEIRAHLEESGRGALATNSETRQFVSRAAQIQLHQVQAVFEHLTRSAESLLSGIESLRTETSAAAEVTVKVGATTLDAKVARQCQSGIGEILEIVKQAVQKIADILAAFEPLQASFVDCTGKATKLASDVRLAGLNAQIFAIQAPEGATLEILAGRVRMISEEVIQHVAQMGISLNHTTEMVNNLRQRLEDFQILGKADEDVLDGESAKSRNKLSELEHAIPVLIESITRRQGAFAQSIEETLANVHFPATVTEASSRSIGFFRDLVAWGGEGGHGSAVASGASQRIDLLQSKYTMESERLAHATALEPTVTGVSAAAPESSIEMFDDFGTPSPTVSEPPEVPADPGKLSEDEPRPTGVAPRETRPAAPTLPGAAKNPAVSEDLGANVELF